MSIDLYTVILLVAFWGAVCWWAGYAWRGLKCKLHHEVTLATWIVPPLPQMPLDALSANEAEKAIWRAYWLAHQEKFSQEYDL